LRRAHIRVEGRVQGVYFRAETRRRALALGISGWVRNTPEGTLEAVFEGEQDPVERLVAWCKRGPPGAIVEAVSVDWDEDVSHPSGAESGFVIV
jgi:acylphosphatase